MSRTTALRVAPDRRPVTLTEFHNAWGWAPSIWGRLLRIHGYDDRWVLGAESDKGLNKLWQDIETLPEWQQAPLVLTFDTGVIPYQAFEWAADQLAEFDRRCPAPADHANHVPAMADLLRSKPEAPLIGVYGTSVSENPFDPWCYDEDDEGNVIKDEPGSGISLSAMYVLSRHRHFLDRGGQVKERNDHD